MGAAAALYGPLHGGANEEVLKMLTEIGHVKNANRQFLGLGQKLTYLSDYFSVAVSESKDAGGSYGIKVHVYADEMATALTDVLHVVAGRSAADG